MIPDIGIMKKINGKLMNKCCCNCKNQIEIMRHPNNKISGGRMKGPVTKIAGYGCKAVYEGEKIVFFETAHSMCELHQFKEIK